ncbi:hypothetical protein QBC37DRAFT_452725 [Rhypophila decipiens]|uniref:Uncharacterized protein n=1 Tax=Rhypophila decipiens TaxID=261697 RepID=A0AAN6YKS3_9PEZI|nr:hypothetical protein QBC37DRAFT_452725 [Rhypophila decipiens]
MGTTFSRKDLVPLVLLTLHKPFCDGAVASDAFKINTKQHRNILWRTRGRWCFPTEVSRWSVSIAAEAGQDDKTLHPQSARPPEVWMEPRRGANESVGAVLTKSPSASSISLLPVFWPFDDITAPLTCEVCSDEAGSETSDISLCWELSLRPVYAVVKLYDSPACLNIAGRLLPRRPTKQNSSGSPKEQLDLIGRSNQVNGTGSSAAVDETDLMPESVPFEHNVLETPGANRRYGLTIEGALGMSS